MPNSLALVSPLDATAGTAVALQIDTLPDGVVAVAVADGAESPALLDATIRYE